MNIIGSKSFNNYRRWDALRCILERERGS